MSKLYIHIAIHKTWFSSWKPLVHECILGCNHPSESVIWEIFIAEDQGRGTLGIFRTGMTGPLLEGPHSLGLFGLNPSSIFIHLLTSVHLRAYSWGTFEILIKSLIFRIQRHRTWRGLHSVALLALIFESCSHWASPAQKNINHMKGKCLAWAVRSYVYLTEHICV